MFINKILRNIILYVYIYKVHLVNIFVKKLSFDKNINLVYRYKRSNVFIKRS